MASDNNNNNNSGSSYLSPKDQPKRYNIEAIERKDRYKEKRTEQFRSRLCHQLRKRSERISHLDSSHSIGIDLL